MTFYCVVLTFKSAKMLLLASILLGPGEATHSELLGAKRGLTRKRLPAFACRLIVTVTQAFCVLFVHLVQTNISNTKKLKRIKFKPCRKIVPIK